MTQPAKSQEPSMEEILASIRRIIADDDAAKTAPPAPEPARPAPRPVRRRGPPPHRLRRRPRRHHLRLSRSSLRRPKYMPNSPTRSLRAMRTWRITRPIFSISPSSMEAPSFSQPAPPPAQPPQFRKIEAFSDVSFDESEQKPAVRLTEAPIAHVPRDGGDQGLLSNATSAAVDSAFNTLAQTVLVKNARTLEDLVREMLRPMLKSWLDDNLPGMVERLVRAEIERVARGR